MTSSAGSIYLDGTYLRQNATWHAEDSAWKAEHIATLLLRNGIRPASVGEVGCGAGEVLRQLAPRFPHARFVGYELSPQAFALCRSRPCDRIAFEQKDLLAEAVQFDCLLCIDVIEHVEDYVGFVRRLAAKARYKLFHIPLDLSALAVMRGAMLEERASVGHLHYFTRDTALATLADCGLQILDWRYTPHFLLAPVRGPAALARRAVRRLLFARAPDLAVRLWGGCSLMVLAR